LKYFFDNCISFRLANMLAALEVEAVALRDAFPASIDDETFLASLKDTHDVYITYDHKQRSREAEARAIKEAGVTALWIGPFWGKMSFWQQAKWLVARLETIDHFATSVVAGTCAEIKQNGKARTFHL
jgi:hypothetical protein